MNGAKIWQSHNRFRKTSRSLGTSSFSTRCKNPFSTRPTSGPGATPAAITSRPLMAKSFRVKHWPWATSSSAFVFISSNSAKRQNRRVHYERHDPLGARLSPSGKRYGDFPQKQRALYCGEQRDRQRKARHAGVCPVHQYHVRMVCKGHQQESKNGHPHKGDERKANRNRSPIRICQRPRQQGFLAG